MSVLQKLWQIGGIAKNMNDATNNRHARRMARKLERKLERQETSDIFTTPTLADLEALDAGGHFDPDGDFIGWYIGDHRMITHQHDGHSLTKAAPGVGKTSEMALPTLMHDAGQYSLVVVDIDHELSRSTRDYFARLGYDVVTLNPSRAYNIPDCGYNPLIKIAQLLRSGNFEQADKLAQNLAKIYKPEKLDAKEHDWVGEGNRRWLWLGILTECDSSDWPTLANVFDVLSEGAEAALGWVYGSTCIPQLLKAARRFENELNAQADKQAHWQVDGASTPLELFQSGTALSESTQRHGVDFANTKKRLTIVYISVASEDLRVQGPWISTLLAAAMDDITAASGPYTVKLVADEFSNIPRIPDFLTTMQLCRKRRLRLDLYTQSTQSLRRRYGREEADEIENTCSVVRYLSVTDTEEAKKLSAWSGTKTVFVQSMSTSQRRDALGNVSAAEQKLEKLSVAEVLNLPSDHQLVRVDGLGLLQCKRKPWWLIEPWNDGRILNLRDIPDNRGDKAPLQPFSPRKE